MPLWQVLALHGSRDRASLAFREFGERGLARQRGIVVCAAPIVGSRVQEQELTGGDASTLFVCSIDDTDALDERVGDMDTAWRDCEDGFSALVDIDGIDGIGLEINRDCESKPVAVKESGSS